MIRIYLIFFTLLGFMNATNVKADVLGPYITDSNVPATPIGYDRIVFPLLNANAPVTASLVICDENGKQYTLTARESGGSPYCYFMEIGTYRIVSLTNCEIQSSNWGNLIVGSTFYVNGQNGGYITLKYTGEIPEMQSILQVLGADTRPADKPYYKIMKVYGIEANGSGILVDGKGNEYSVFNYTGYTGGAHYFYILPGTYTIKKIGTTGNYSYLEINGTRKLLSAGVSFSILYDPTIVFTKNPLQ